MIATTSMPSSRAVSRASISRQLAYARSSAIPMSRAAAFARSAFDESTAACIS
jgi:hypothetical protein